MEEIELKVGKEDFKNFINIISMIKDYCRDLDVVSSRVCQLNDNKIALFDINLLPVFGKEISFSMSGLKKKVDLFKKIFKDSDEVTIKTSETLLTLCDNISVIEFECPDRSFLDNQYVDNVDKLMGISNDDIIAMFEIPISLANRTENICYSFGNRSINVIIDKNKISFCSNNMSKTERAVIFSVDTKCKNLDDQISFWISDILFSVKFDDCANVFIYKRSSGDFIFCFSGKVSSVETKIYSSSYIEYV